MAKLPPTAFGEYVAMGAARSYEAIAKRHGCSKKAVTKRGTKEHWQERIAEAEESARKATTAKAGESLSALHDRHLRMVRMVQAKSIEVLRSTPLRTAMDAVRAIAIALREERSLMGLDDADKVQDAETDELKENIIDAAPSWQRDLLEYIPDMRSLKSRKKLINQFEASRTDVPGKDVQDNDTIKAQFFKAIENAADESRIVAPHTDAGD